MSSIYSFVDYRQFLRQDFAERKARNERFSLRAAAQKLGINSGTVVRLLSGKRNLSKRLLPRVFDFLKLGPQEAQYFELLVDFDRSASVLQRQQLYAEIVIFSRRCTCPNARNCRHSAPWG